MSLDCVGFGMEGMSSRQKRCQYAGYCEAEGRAFSLSYDTEHAVAGSSWHGESVGKTIVENDVALVAPS